MPECEIMSFSEFVKSLARKILDVDSTEQPKEQVELLLDCAQRFRSGEHPEDMTALLQWLLEKHFVSSITVASRNGSLVVSSNGHGEEDAVQAATLFNVVSSEHPRSEAVFVKGDSWKMVIPFKDRLYLVHAAADLTHTELTVIAKEIEDFLQKGHEAF